MKTRKFFAVSIASLFFALVAPEALAYSVDSISNATDRPSSASRDVSAHARLRSRVRRSLTTTTTTRRSQTTGQRNRIPRRLVQENALKRRASGGIGTLRKFNTSAQRRRTAEVDTSAQRRLRKANSYQMRNTNTSRNQSRNLKRRRVEFKRRAQTSEESDTE